MFPGCRRFDGSLDALLQEAFVTSAVADREARTLELELRLTAPIPPVYVAAVEQAVAEEYCLSAVTVTPSYPKRTAPKKNDGTGKVILGKQPKKAPSITPMREVDLDLGHCTVQGEVFAVNHREIPKANAWVINFDMTDHTGSVHVSRFMREEGAGAVAASIREGMTLLVGGTLGYSKFDPDLTLSPELIVTAERTEREDLAEDKRVELHLHTVMSAMDALTDTETVIKRAIRWGHPAIAITDHGVAQSFPDAMKAAGDKIKVLYGVEGYYVNDVDDRAAVYGPVKGSLAGEIVAFDIETTGLNTEKERITEIGAVLLKDGEEMDRFQTFVDPGMPIPAEITRLTGIRNEDVAGAPGQEEAVRRLLAFADGRPLAAHNAGFDIGFIYEACERYGIPFEPAYVDTLALSRALLPDLKNHRLDTVADRLGLPQFNHHRASDDAVTAGLILKKMLEILRGEGVERAEEIDPYLTGLRHDALMKRRFKPNHIILLVKSQAGIKNLYRIITDSHLKYFHRYPIMPKSLLMRCREGLLIGSACEAG
jgi:DNA polymerase-3 subunit alpha (Gram-positive type)